MVEVLPIIAVLVSKQRSISRAVVLGLTVQLDSIVEKVCLGITISPSTSSATPKPLTMPPPRTFNEQQLQAFFNIYNGRRKGGPRNPGRRCPF